MPKFELFAGRAGFPQHRHGASGPSGQWSGPRSSCTTNFLGEQKTNLELDKAKQKRNTPTVSRWAMSPVHSIPAPGYRIRRRPVPPSAASLFPHSPDATTQAMSPNAMVSELAPLTDPSGSLNRPSAGCPPLVAGDGGSAEVPAHAGLLLFLATNVSSLIFPLRGGGHVRLECPTP